MLHCQDLTSKETGLSLTSPSSSILVATIMTQMTRTTLASIDYTLVPELNLASHRSKSSCEAIPSLLSHTNEHTQVCPERPCPGAGLKNKWTREKPEIAYRSSAIFFTRRVLKNAMRLFFSHQIANQDLCVCVCV